MNWKKWIALAALLTAGTASATMPFFKIESLVQKVSHDTYKLNSAAFKPSYGGVYYYYNREAQFRTFRHNSECQLRIDAGDDKKDVSVFPFIHAGRLFAGAIGDFPGEMSLNGEDVKLKKLAGLPSDSVYVEQYDKNKPTSFTYKLPVEHRDAFTHFGKRWQGEIRIKPLGYFESRPECIRNLVSGVELEDFDIVASSFDVKKRISARAKQYFRRGLKENPIHVNPYNLRVETREGRVNVRFTEDFKIKSWKELDTEGPLQTFFNQYCK